MTLAERLRPCRFASTIVSSPSTICFRAATSSVLIATAGDFLVRRSDEAFAYQLAVVVDDAAQGVNSVVRGIDLLCSSPQQVYLQDLLGLPHACYAHVPLLVDDSGRRLAKRSKSATLDELMNRFKIPRRSHRAYRLHRGIDRFG